MLYNGQRILIFTDDRVLAATVFKVQTVLSTWFGEIYVVFVFYYIPKDVMEWSLSVCLSVCLSVFLSVCLLSTVHSNYWMDLQENFTTGVSVRSLGPEI